eukprot:TRINITY_DN7477_c0_g1_i1.p3 TRINITY_DN7477_c0_g1~~TRINITY_DN7477_c0_g1_i1.p3  ORF type:complete len:247 (+),score=12.69 TRINITY_DN7477_c0_g1_i1:97-741(+)
MKRTKNKEKELKQKAPQDQINFCITNCSSTISFMSPNKIAAIAMTYNLNQIIIVLISISSVYGKECVDVVLPSTPEGDCSMVAKNNLCDIYVVRRVYCSKTCGYCEVPSKGVCKDGSDISCDVEALIAFKTSLTSGGDFLSSWTGEDPYNWQYIECAEVYEGQNRLIKINLAIYSGENKLNGTLSPELSKLRYLQVFKLRSPEPYPQSLAQWII